MVIMAPVFAEFLCFLVVVVEQVDICLLIKKQIEVGAGACNSTQKYFETFGFLGQIQI